MKTTRELPCKLTEKEKARKAEEICQLIADYDDLEATAKEEARTNREKLVKIRERKQKLSREHRNGVEYREVEVEEQRDYRLGEVTTIRLDTGEVFRTRPMSPAERQEKLPLIDKTLELVEDASKQLDEPQAEQLDAEADIEPPPDSDVKQGRRTKRRWPGKPKGDGQEARR